MSKKRRQHSAQFKAQVGLEALKGIEPIHAIVAKFRVHPLRVSHWKQETAERLLVEVFLRKADLNAQEAKEREKELFEENGRLKMELAWSKKNRAGSSVEKGRRMIEPQRQRCRLPGSANCSGWRGPATITGQSRNRTRTCD